MVGLLESSTTLVKFLALVLHQSKLKTPLHRAGYYLNPFYYYQNKKSIEENESFRDGVITCITKLVPDEDTQDLIIEEIQKFQDAEGPFGKDIAKR